MTVTPPVLFQGCAAGWGPAPQAAGHQEHPAEAKTGRGDLTAPGDRAGKCDIPVKHAHSITSISHP